MVTNFAIDYPFFKLITYNDLLIDLAFGMCCCNMLLNTLLNDIF